VDAEWLAKAMGEVSDRKGTGGLPNPWPNTKEAEVMEDKEAMALNNRSYSVDTTISTTPITGSLHWGSITGNQYKVN